MGGGPDALLASGGGRPLRQIVETLETVLAGCPFVVDTPERSISLGRRAVGPMFPEGRSPGGPLGATYSGGPHG